MFENIKEVVAVWELNCPHCRPLFSSVAWHAFTNLLHVLRIKIRNVNARDFNEIFAYNIWHFKEIEDKRLAFAVATPQIRVVYENGAMKEIRLDMNFEELFDKDREKRKIANNFLFKYFQKEILGDVFIESCYMVRKNRLVRISPAYIRRKLEYQGVKLKEAEIEKRCEIEAPERSWIKGDEVIWALERI